MAGMKTIIVLAFLLASGILAAILSCALGSNWLPLLSVFTFLLAPFPNIICRRISGSTGGDYMSEDSNFFVVSGIGLPVVLNHSAIITDLALILSLCGGILIYTTILGYFHYFVEQPSDPYSY
ncbi:vacuolar protein sorting 55 [Entophlyctis helioformis]|nr:vacuolar protein sorting 55 [Entophlyctis helioformis]